MAQTGCYEKRNGWWLLRYREQVVENGEIKSILRNRKLTTLEEFPPKRRRRPTAGQATAQSNGGECDNLSKSNGCRKRFDDVPDGVKQLAREFLDATNDEQRSPEQVRRLDEFVEQVYFPSAQDQLKPSTLKGYRSLWRRDLKARLSDVWMRDVRTYTVNGWLRDIAQKKRTLSKATLQRLKSFLSGIFTEAKNMGYFDAPNPVRDANLPRALEGQKTHAHSLAEIKLMLQALENEPLAATVVAVAAYVGLRRGEIRGLRWEEYNRIDLPVIRSVWEGYIGEPKTEASVASVPIIAPLREKLDDWRVRCGNPTSGWMFASEAGTPVHLGNLINRQILPALKLAGLNWKGFHAFRRGLATNLHELGIPAETIRLILRHSDVITTQRSYIKPTNDEVRKAMAKLETRLNETSLDQGHTATSQRLM